VPAENPANAANVNLVKSRRLNSLPPDTVSLHQSGRFVSGALAMASNRRAELSKKRAAKRRHLK
jgi:hypothetical protein